MPYCHHRPLQVYENRLPVLSLFCTHSIAIQRRLRPFAPFFLLEIVAVPFFHHIHFQIHGISLDWLFSWIFFPLSFSFYLAK